MTNFTPAWMTRILTETMDLSDMSALSDAIVAFEISTNDNSCGRWVSRTLLAVA